MFSSSARASLNILALGLAVSPLVAQEPKVETPPKVEAASRYAPAAKLPKISLERVLPNLKFIRPIQMLQAPMETGGVVYVVEQPGRIVLADLTQDSATESSVAFDIRERVNDSGNEEGLLSIAFHPDYPKRRELYVYYTAASPRRSILSRFTIAADGKSMDPASEEILLTQSQPYSNHNGGTCLFGPDGFLYLSLGDGGAANDPHENGQNPQTFLSKVLRIDVNAKSEGKAYAIPSDNPFVNDPAYLPEIWATGTRNIWRMQFDRKNGDLWAGDVGQNKYEEIDLIKKGGNYGWNLREGFHAFAKQTTEAVFIEPLIEHPRREGVSITGGYVCRDPKLPTLEGAYLYADFGYGTIWAAKLEGDKCTKPELLCKKPTQLISSFAEMNDASLYVIGFDGGQDAGITGSIWKIQVRP